MLGLVVAHLKFSYACVVRFSLDVPSERRQAKETLWDMWNGDGVSPSPEA